MAGTHDLRSLGDAENTAAGLYTGLAGRCFVLERAGRIGGNAELREAAAECLATLVESAVPGGNGIQWNEVTDVIAGSAGIGLTLLWAHEILETPRALEVAVAAGDRLLERAIPDEGGAKWAMTEDFPRLMPNFSHGTAGIS